MAQKLVKFKKNTDRDHNNLTVEIFIAKLEKLNLSTKADIADFWEKTDFDNKLKKLINKKVISDKTKHAETEKRLTDLTNKVAKIPEKGHDILLGRINFTGDNGHQIFLSFCPNP